MRKIYLWQDDKNQLHCLTPDQHTQQPMPELEIDSAQITQNAMDAAACLPETVWAALKGEQATTWVLDASLPQSWPRLAWEQLSHRGHPLEAWLQVIRYAQIQDSALTVGSKTLIWHQWPDDDFTELSQDARVKCRSSLKLIQRQIEHHEDLGGYQRLIILAHGGESDSVPLLDKQGQPWDIQWPVTLPPEVWIMACANHNGNMHTLATECLQRGARRVVCGHGRLNARLMQSLLLARLQQPEIPLSEFLSVQRPSQPQEAGGVQALRYYGEIKIEAFERQTLGFYQQAGSSSSLISQTIKAHAEKAQALPFLNQVENGLSTQNWTPLTLSWLLPSALYLAEKYRHDLMPSLTDRYQQLEKNEPRLFCDACYSLASAHRRVGHYGKALNVLAQGLNHATFDDEKMRLFGALLNDAIDLNLPQSGQLILDELQLLFNFNDDAEQAFRLLDRQARLVVRQGDMTSALNFLTQKQQHAQHYKETGEREQAGLLYLAAWTKNERAHHWAEQARNGLTLQQIGQGNETTAYLLRALAVYDWRFGTSLITPEMVSVCRQALGNDGDSGPWASVLLYCGLQHGLSDDWKPAQQAMEKYQYWLELAAFQSLAGHISQAQRSLKQFHKIRAACLPNLAALPIDDLDLAAEIAQQTEQERAILLNPEVTPDQLWQQGLLPL